MVFTAVCVGITLKQGYNTACKFAETPMSTQMNEIPLQGNISLKLLYISDAHVQLFSFRSFIMNDLFRFFFQSFKKLLFALKMIVHFTTISFVLSITNR